MKEYIILRREIPTASHGLAGVRAVATDPSLTVERVPAHALAELVAEPEVALVAPKMPTRLIKPKAAKAETRAEPWGVERVAGHSRYTGNGVTVAVLDTGIDAEHPAFAGVDLVEKDFSGSGNGDALGHGTHCAGVIFGRGLATRIGVAPGISRALIGKVLDNKGGGSSEMIFNGMLWALEQRAHISMSLGFDFPGMVKSRTSEGWPVQLATSEALETYRGNLRMFDAIMGMTKARAAFGTSALVVAAAGNESRRGDDPEYRLAASLPAAADDVISVAAVGRASGGGLRVADFSNTMATLSAPGVGITSARTGGGLKTMSGSSMACPHVAGVAALWWEAIGASGKKATARNVRAQLIATARSEGILQWDEVDVGQGVVVAP